jgi:phosphoribosyl 1,2-cyclic phosphodiesterase
VRVSVLGSGSSGNSTLIATEKTCVLVDLGFGPRSLARRLSEAGLKEQKIDAILVTHGHTDHTSGIPTLLKKQNIPIYTNQGTRREATNLREVVSWNEFVAGEVFVIGDLVIEAFSTSHDAVQPVGFRITSGGIKGAVGTDLGEIGSAVAGKLEGCDWLVLESNHDEHMLKVGPYPWALKQRVLSRRGHLSNEDLAQFLAHRFDGSSQHLFLAHLSRFNNHPDIALSSARRALLSRPDALFESCRVHLTHQSKPSIVLDL